MDTVDRDRADFIQKYFMAEWPRRTLYHAMLNTAIGDDTVVEMILNFKRSCEMIAPAENHSSTPA